MKTSFNIIYTIASAVIALAFVIFPIQPTLFLMSVFATHNGDNTYYAMPVFLITWFILLSPLFVYFSITKLIRKKDNKPIASDKTGIFVTRNKAFQSSMVGISIYINDKKAGIVDNGKTKFFNAQSGVLIVQAGQGKQASEKLQVTLTEGQQLHFEMEIITLGMRFKYSIKQV